MLNICPRCTTENNWDAKSCQECNADLGVPNQRELLEIAERHALQARYQEARDNAQAMNTLAQFEQMKDDIEQNSRAVINIKIKDLSYFMSDDSYVLSNYNLQTKSESRLAADIHRDRQRRMAEAAFFGIYAEKIRYAALSLENRGLTSYGDCTLILKDNGMQWRATVLEENSFTFCDKHLGDIWKHNVPKGYRAIWAERHLLAVIKLAPKLNCVPVNCAALILQTEGNRATDEFMEVHIYGAVSWTSIAAIALPSPTDDIFEQYADLPELRKQIKKHDIACLES